MTFVQKEGSDEDERIRSLRTQMTRAMLSEQKENIVVQQNMITPTVQAPVVSFPRNFTRNFAEIS